jgi:hypothetical protein
MLYNSHKRPYIIDVIEIPFETHRQRGNLLKFSIINPHLRLTSKSNSRSTRQASQDAHTCWYSSPSLCRHVRLSWESQPFECQRVEIPKILLSKSQIVFPTFPLQPYRQYVDFKLHNLLRNQSNVQWEPQRVLLSMGSSLLQRQLWIVTAIYMQPSIGEGRVL